MLVLSSLSPGGGSGLSFSLCDRDLWADSGPAPGGNLFCSFILALSAAGVQVLFAKAAAKILCARLTQSASLGLGGHRAGYLGLGLASL